MYSVIVMITVNDLLNVKTVYVYIHGFYINVPISGNLIVDTSLTVDHELFTYHETLWSHCITYKISWFDPYTVQLTSLIWEVCDILQINA